MHWKSDNGRSFPCRTLVTVKMKISMLGQSNDEIQFLKILHFAWSVPVKLQGPELND